MCSRLGRFRVQGLGFRVRDSELQGLGIRCFRLQGWWGI